ncbi:hypothetical protein VTI74DRAFT_6969 [Chaetomium olivicolor]
MRGHRLEKYIPLGETAFVALKAIEESAMPEDLARKKKKSEKELEQLGEVRQAMKARMRHDPNFLGGTNEIGIAMRVPTWEYSPPCYLCAAIMGYQDPSGVARTRRRGRLQSFHMNILNGRDLKWQHQVWINEIAVFFYLEDLECAVLQRCRSGGPTVTMIRLAIVYAIYAIYAIYNMSPED